MARESAEWKIDLFKWHINLCRLFNAKAILPEEQ